MEIKCISKYLGTAYLIPPHIKCRRDIDLHLIHSAPSWDAHKSSFRNWPVRVGIQLGFRGSSHRAPNHRRPDTSSPHCSREARPPGEGPLPSAGSPRWYQTKSSPKVLPAVTRQIPRQLLLSHTTHTHNYQALLRPRSPLSTHISSVIPSSLLRHLAPLPSPSPQPDRTNFKMSLLRIAARGPTTSTFLRATTIRSAARVAARPSFSTSARLFAHHEESFEEFSAR